MHNTFSSLLNPDASILTPSIARQHVKPCIGKGLCSFAQNRTQWGPAKTVIAYQNWHPYTSNKLHRQVNGFLYDAAQYQIFIENELEVATQTKTLFLYKQQKMDNRDVNETVEKANLNKPNGME